MLILKVSGHSCNTFFNSKASMLLRNFKNLNPILTGGGGSIWPPPPLLSCFHAFMTFFFQVLRIFWYQVCENRTVGRKVTWRFVLARRQKICPKSAFCRFVYKTHGNYWFSWNALKQCLFCLFGHLHKFLYLEINQDQITRKKNHKNNEIHKK